MKVYLICGYKGTGKDTLFRQCRGDLTFNWLDHRGAFLESLNSQSKTSNIRVKALTLRDKTLIRLAFADQVKAELCQENSGEYRQSVDKEALITGKTFRQHCIDYATRANSTIQRSGPRQSIEA